MGIDPTLQLLRDPRRHMFFTGKGGVGKTSIACAYALALSDAGKRVLLVSTDPASNLDEMLGQTLSNQPAPIPGAPNLHAMNIDPESAAQDYRDRVIAQMSPDSASAEQASVREQLSCACTTEIAAFDEFVGLLAGDAYDFDHVIFDTAPVDAPSGCCVYKHRARDVAGDHSRHRSSGASGRSSPRQHRAFCVGDQPQLVRLGFARPRAGRAQEFRR
jgi:hypothetical protein